MKSEHRHELKTSELERLTEKVRPFLDQYSKHIIGVLVLLLVAAIVWTTYSNQSAQARSAGWNAWTEANSAEDFGNVADKYPDNDVGVWARLVEAELLLRTGVRQSFVNRDAGNSDTKAAMEGFEKVLAQPDLPYDVQVRAQYGLARTLETRSDGKTEDVIAAYERLVQTIGIDPVYAEYKRAAEERVKELNKEGVQDFYAWFKAQNPKPTDIKAPLDGATGSTPVDSESPEFSELLKNASEAAPKFPTFPAPKANDAETERATDGDKPEAETPAADDAASDEAKPAEPAADESN